MKAPSSFLRFGIVGPIQLAFLIALQSAFAGSAIWNLDPTSGDWNAAANWMPNAVPDGPEDTATFELSSVTDISVSANTEVNGIIFNSGASAFTITVNPGQTLALTGIGITNSSGVTQTFVSDVDVEGNMGRIRFTNSATAGDGTRFINSGSIWGNEEGGLTELRDTSSAGNGTFISNAASAPGWFGGHTEFHESATAGEGVFIANGGSFDGGTTQFFDSANSGNGTFITNGGDPAGGSTFFFGQASAGNGTFITNGGKSIDGNFGEIIFNNSTTADHGRFIINGAKPSGAAGGRLLFVDHSTAAEAMFVVNGGTASGAGRGEITFLSDSTAGTATIIINGGVDEGGDCAFGDDADGGTARVEIFGNGTLTLLPASSRPVALGSIEGDGNVINFATLNLGSNNLSTVFSGVIQGSSFTKIGAGALTLTGANTYVRRTSIRDGALIINNETGSGTGTGDVMVGAGTLAGSGTIAGPVTVGTGGSAGAFLRPSLRARRATTLTIQSALVFKADATYTEKLDTRAGQADQVVANGVTIEDGAQFSFTSVAHETLPTGTVFTAISNTSPDPIGGTFANLPDGSTFTAGRNSFQASYSGGDGNDLTLTVIP